MLAERIHHNAWAQKSAQVLFRESCASRPDKAALVYKGEQITYRELQERVDRLTQALADVGVGRGDVVAMLPSPTPDFAVVFFATLQSGATINALNLLWEPDVLTEVLRRTAPIVVFSVGCYQKRDYVELLGQCLNGVDGGGERAHDARPQRVIITEDAGVVPDELPIGFERMRAFEARTGDVDLISIEQRVRDADPLESQYLCQTSGSTGLPKTAVWNHRSPLSTAHFLAANLGILETDRWLNLSPFFHNSGIDFALLMGLAYAGNTVYLTERFDPDEAVDLIQDEGIEATFGFSAHCVALRSSSRYDASKFAVGKFFFAGQPAFYEYVREMCQPDTTIMSLYAQTENGPAISFTELGNIDDELRASNHGRPLPGVQVKVRDVDTREELPDGRPGQIWYKSPYLFLGYLEEDGSVTLPLDEDGYFASGDYGVMSAGYLTFLERLGGVVKSGGENVSLAKVAEALVAEFGDVFEDVHAVAIPDPYWGDRVVAVARPKAPGTVSIAEVRTRCKDRLAGYEVPRSLVEWDGPWPVSPEGKLSVKDLRQHAISSVDVDLR